MRKPLVLLFCFLCFGLFFNGCRKSTTPKGQAEAKKEAETKKEAVKVIIKDGEGFPEFLVGTWEATNLGRWEITFDSNGTIPLVIHDWGKVNVKAKHITTIPMEHGGESFFKAGNWLVEYSHSSNELRVEIVMDYIHFDMGEIVIETEVTDTLSGRVAEDGSYWFAEWHSVPYYTIVYTPEPKEIEEDPNSFLKGYIIFKKVEDSEPQQ